MSRPQKPIIRITAERRALLQTLLRKEGMGKTPAEITLPEEDEGPPPLSFAQERIWFFE